MTSDQRVRTPMFVDEPGTGLVISDLRRYNLFTAAFFRGGQGRLLRELADRTDFAPGEDALDIGCGPGKLVRVLGGRAGRGGSVTGVDPSDAAVAHNRRRDPHNRYIRSAAQDLAFPDAAFDVVTCTFVMHHIPERYRGDAISEMWRVLRPGGRLLLADAHPSDVVRAAFTLGDRVRRRGATDRFEAVDIRRYSPMLGEVGFDTVEFTTSRHSTGVLTAAKPAE